VRLRGLSDGTDGRRTIPVLAQIIGQASQIQNLQRELCYRRYYKEILRVSNIYPEYHFSIIGKTKKVARKLINSSDGILEMIK
jgi:hypothetical protein